VGKERGASRTALAHGARKKIVECLRQTALLCDLLKRRISLAVPRMARHATSALQTVSALREATRHNSEASHADVAREIVAQALSSWPGRPFPEALDRLFKKRWRQSRYAPMTKYVPEDLFGSLARPRFRVMIGSLMDGLAPGGSWEIDPEASASAELPGYGGAENHPSAQAKSAAYARIDFQSRRPGDGHGFQYAAPAVSTCDTPESSGAWQARPSGSPCGRAHAADHARGLAAIWRLLVLGAVCAFLKIVVHHASSELACHAHQLGPGVFVLAGG